MEQSPTFPEMLKDLEAWMDKHDLRDADNRLKNAMWVTDGVSRMSFQTRRVKLILSHGISGRF